VADAVKGCFLLAISGRIPSQLHACVTPVKVGRSRRRLDRLRLGQLPGPWGTPATSGREEVWLSPLPLALIADRLAGAIFGSGL
jgi:hypothetical protein